LIGSGELPKLALLQQEGTSHSLEKIYGDKEERSKPSYTKDKEAKIQKKLKDLGYIK
jgi:hypothetical protein